MLYHIESETLTWTLINNVIIYTLEQNGPSGTVLKLVRIY
jgi:hypothetical protein